jgi:hypothetical protein
LGIKGYRCSAGISGIGTLRDGNAGNNLQECKNDHQPKTSGHYSAVVPKEQTNPSPADPRGAATAGLFLIQVMTRVYDTVSVTFIYLPA